MGVYESTNSSGVEFRLHEIDSEHVVRVPWHKDEATGQWYDGVWGPAIRMAALVDLLTG